MATFLLFTWTTLTLVSQLAGAQDHVNSTTQGDVQVRIFENSSFSSEYAGFPIHVEKSKIVYVEVEATKNDRVAIPKECHVSAYKNFTDRPRHELIREHCPQDYDVDYLPSHNRTIRFKFTIRQFFGVQEQFLFLHCQMTTCRSKKAPKLTGYRKGSTNFTAKRNCERPGQHCPHRRERKITMGPFVMWPGGFTRDQPNLGIKSKVQTKTNSTTHEEVQVTIFRNESFSLEYTRFPIGVKLSKKIYVQVEATKDDHVVIPKECHVNAFKNGTVHRPSEGYILIHNHCSVAIDSDYLPTHNKAVRFKFTIGQLSGPENQFLYLHCKMTTCQRDEVPKMRKFNCLTQSQYCPHQNDSEITTGPFVVRPVGLRRTRKNLEIKNRANKPVQGDVQVGIFSNDSFNHSFKYDGYPTNPIHIDMNTKIYVEVKATKSDRVVVPKECHVSPYKNCTDHGPSLAFLLISNYCPVTLESNYLPTHVGEAVAIRFKFTLRQYFGLFEQFLYLHCKMTTCRRKELPYPDVFNCRTQAQHCPYQEETDITAGPFVVWPVGFKRDRKSLETKAKPSESTEQEATEFSNKDTNKVCLNYIYVTLLSTGSFVLGVITIWFIILLIKWYKERNKETEMEVQV